MLQSAVAFISLCSYSTLLETVANEMTISFKTKWYEALLRQDITYFDKQEDVSRFATIISVNGAKYQRGIGNKLGLLFQFMATFIGGIVYAFYSSCMVESNLAISKANSLHCLVCIIDIILNLFGSY